MFVFVRRHGGMGQLVSPIWKFSIGSIGVVSVLRSVNARKLVPLLFSEYPRTGPTPAKVRVWSPTEGNTSRRVRIKIRGVLVTWTWWAECLCVQLYSPQSQHRETIGSYPMERHQEGTLILHPICPLQALWSTK